MFQAEHANERFSSTRDNNTENSHGNPEVSRLQQLSVPLGEFYLHLDDEREREGF